MENKNKDSSSSNGSINCQSPSVETKWRFSRTHQKRFHRRFKEIDENEQLIDWFSCGLLADIILQGYLYISQNYFCFYSNIFTYKTHIMIPIDDVVDISKAYTMKIFPNAIKIISHNHQYVFGSLFSRERSFKLLTQVWLAKINCINHENSNDELKRQCCNFLNSDFKEIEVDTKVEATELKAIRVNDEQTTYHEPVRNSLDSLVPVRSQSNKSHSLGSGGAYSFAIWKNNTLLHGHETGNEHHEKQLRKRRLHKSETDCNLIQDPKMQKWTRTPKCQSIARSRKLFQSWSNYSLLSFIIVIMLALLFFSAILLMFKINEAHEKILTLNSNRTMTDKRFLVGQQIHRVVSVLKTNLIEIDEIKTSLEKLLQRVGS